MCNDYNEYLQFAKDLYSYKGLSNEIYGYFDEEKGWIEDEYEWSALFNVDVKMREDEETNEYWEEMVDPVNDSYEIKEKPDKEEYPVIVHYDNYFKNILWVSLNKLKGDLDCKR